MGGYPHSMQTEGGGGGGVAAPNAILDYRMPIIYPCCYLASWTLPLAEQRHRSHPQSFNVYLEHAAGSISTVFINY